MPTRPWIRQLFTRKVTRTICKAPRQVRPVLEEMEVRWVLSAFTGTKPLDGSLATLGRAKSTNSGPAVFARSTAQAVPGVVPVEVMGPQGKWGPLVTPGPTGYTPQQLQTAYGLNQVLFSGIKGDGAGQTIALVDAFDNPSFVNSTDPAFATSALHIFDQTFGLPDPPSFTKVNQDGQAAPLASPSAIGGWSTEIALDIEWAHAMAPAASIILVEANSGFFDDLTTAAATAGQLASVVSMSWGGGEFPEESSLDSIFQVPGVTYLASTGDNGAPGFYPAYSPHVVAVGGTSLYNLDANGDYPGTGTNGEVGWSLGSDSYAPDMAGGGGISQVETEPSYQLSVQSTGSRTIPDIAADADPSTGVPVYDPYDYSKLIPWAQLGGTSLASPLMAGMIAQADQGRVLSGGQTFSSDQVLAALYSLQSSKPDDFHDIVSGFNGFNAGPGYDLVTGLGTPNGRQLVPDLAFSGLSSQPTLTSIVVTPSSPTVDRGFTQQFKAVGAFASGVSQDITSSVDWASATPSVATIDASGLATTHAAGTSVITAALDGVTSPGVTLTSLPLVALAIAPNNPNVPVLLSVPFTVTGTFSDGSTQAIPSTWVTWASSKPAVASINSAGLATANALGSSVITASLYGVTSPGDVLKAVAPTFVVNTTADDLNFTAGKTNLREAILAADAYPGHSVTFDPNVFATAKTITLSLGQLELSNTAGTETIKGPKAGVTVNGNNASRVFQVDAGVTASLSGLTITGGSAPDIGGGVYNQGGNVTLTNCTVSGNSALIGGGVGNLGMATLTNCTVSGNLALYGGGVGNLDTATLTACTVSGNFAYYGGGGLFNYGTGTLTACTVSGNTAYLGGGEENFGTATLTKCSVSGNFATASGGGLTNYGTATLNNSTVSGNIARGFYASFGGGVENYGMASLTNSTVSGNFASFGGGVDNHGTAALTNCAFSGNSAFSGGGVENHGSDTLTLTHCTVSGNAALNFGGGLDNNYGTLTLTDCTVDGNQASYGGGLSNTGMATLTHSTVSGNAAYFGGGLANLGTALLSHCTVSGNYGYIGGGVANLGTAVLSHCTVSGNSAYFAGGLYNSGMATLSNCTVSGNSAYFGGGVANYGGGTATLANCTVSGNSALVSGGGMYNHGTATLTNCTVGGNSAYLGGGGLDNYGGTATLTNCIVSGNSAGVGGGISNQGTLIIAASTINNNKATSAGGGISTTGGSATITDTAISNNRVDSLFATLGGGIDCENSVLWLTNCTVNGNQANGATALGGGIYALNSTVNVINSVVSGNKAKGTVDGEGGGIYSLDSILTLLASNVKGNKASTAFDDIFAGP